MSGFRVTLDQARDAIKRLSVSFRIPSDIEPLARQWVDVLGDVEPAEFKRAVDTYLRSEATYFPKAGQLRARALEYRSHVVGPRREDPNRWDGVGPCPVCRARLRELTPRETGDLAIWDKGGMRPRTPDELDTPHRLGVLHNAEAHRRHNAEIIGYSDEDVVQPPDSERGAA